MPKKGWGGRGGGGGGRRRGSWRWGVRVGARAGQLVGPAEGKRHRRGQRDSVSGPTGHCRAPQPGVWAGKTPGCYWHEPEFCQPLGEPGPDLL